MEAIKIEENKYFLSVFETAKFLNVSTHTVYNLINKGELRTVKASKHSRMTISACEIMKYIDRKSGGNE